MMPPATAVVRTHGKRIYAGLASTLKGTADGTLYGSLDDIRAAWSAVVRAGAVEISLSGSPPTELDGSRDDLVDQVGEQLFDSLFVPYAPPADGTGSSYALRWKRAADVPDLPITIRVEGWTWLATSLDARICAHLGALDDSYVYTSYESISLPVSLVVEPSPQVANVVVSLNFGAAHAPEAATFDRAGGTRQLLVSTQRPETVLVSYHAKVSFAARDWPIVETDGAARLTTDAYRIVLRPGTWVRRHTAYLYVRRGDRILAPDEADPADHLTVTATYEGPGLAAPLRTAARITAQAPIEFSYPVPPGTKAGRATLTAIGMVGGQLVRAAELEVAETEEAVYLLVDGGRVQLVGRGAVVSESDALVQRLRQANARPVVSTGVAPSAEDTPGLDTEVGVTLVPQPTDVSCWAAALAMVVGARDGISIAPETIAAAAGMDPATGYGWTDIRAAVAAWGLVEEGPRSAVPAEWARLLQDWGPIWVVEVGAPYHAVVVGAVYGDGSPEETYVKVYNPWPPQVGAIEWTTFLEFDREFGLGAGAGAAMVHANG
jgi:hypothetical protein